MGARFATTFATVLVTLGALSACKPTEGSGVKNDGPVEAPAPSPVNGTKEVVGRLTLGDKRVLLIAKVAEGRPTADLKFRLDEQGTQVQQLVLQLSRDANGHQRCESTGAGFVCRYLDEATQTDFTFRFDRAANELRLVAAVWQGQTVPESGIASKNVKPGDAEVMCDLVSGVNCGF